MKRVILSLFVGLTACFSVFSQPVFRCGNLSGSSAPMYFDYMSDTIVPHTQKMIICDFDTILYKSPVYRSVSITDFKKPNGRVISKIILTEEDDFVADDCTDYLYIHLHDSIRVNDIAYYDDTLYFCGYFNTLYRKGFVARVSISDLFNEGIDIANYFCIGYNVQKIRAFPDNNNNSKTTLIAMGTIEEEQEPYALPIEHIGDPVIWVTPPPKYYDYLLLHCPVSNYSRYYQCEQDTTIEKFQDFTVSEGCAELVSLQYPSDTSDYFYTNSASVLTSNLLIYRKFRTPDLYHKVNKIDIRLYDNVTETFYEDSIKKGIYNVKINLLSVDNFALTFSYFTNNIYSSIVNRVRFHMGIDNARFANMLSSCIYQGRVPKDIIDFQYVNASERLQVLTRGLYDEGGVYDLNISPSISYGEYFLKSTATSSYETVEIEPKDIFCNVSNGNTWNSIGSFNGIVKMKNDCFKLIGEYVCGNYSESFATFQFVRATTSSCHLNKRARVVNQPFPINKYFNETRVFPNSAVSSTISFNKTMTLPKYEVANGFGNCYNENIENVYK